MEASNSFTTAAAAATSTAAAAATSHHIPSTDLRVEEAAVNITRPSDVIVSVERLYVCSSVKITFFDRGLNAMAGHNNPTNVVPISVRL